MALSRKQRLQFWQILLVIGLSVWCLSKIWVTAIVPIEYSLPWLDIVLNNAFFNKLLSSVVLLINIITFQRILVKTALVNRDNLEPLVIYLLVSLMFPFLLLLPSLSLIFVLMFFVGQKILAFSGIENPYSNFTIGLIVGILSLIYRPLIFLLGFVFISYIVTKNFSWKYFFIPILGAVLAYVYYYAILYIFDYNDWAQKFMLSFNHAFSLRHFAELKNTPKILICASLYSLLIIASMVKTAINLDKELISRRKQLMVVLLSLLLTMVLCLLFKDPQNLTFTVFVLLTVFQLALSVDMFKYKVLVYILLVGLCVVNNMSLF